MKRKVTLRYAKVTDTQGMSACPACFSPIGPSRAIELLDGLYGLEGYEDEVERGLAALQSQLESGEGECGFSGEGIRLALSTVAGLPAWEG